MLLGTHSELGAWEQKMWSRLLTTPPVPRPNPSELLEVGRFKAAAGLFKAGRLFTIAHVKATDLDPDLPTLLSQRPTDQHDFPSPKHQKFENTNFCDTSFILKR